MPWPSSKKHGFLQILIIVNPLDGICFLVDIVTYFHGHVLFESVSICMKGNGSWKIMLHQGIQ